MMTLAPTFKRKLIKRGRYFSVSIPPQLAELLGDCQDVTIRASLTENGLFISPVED